MDEQANVFKKQEVNVIETPPSTFNSKMLVNLEKRENLGLPISSPRPFFRLRINLPGSPQQDLKLDRFSNDHRAPVQTTSVIYPIGEEHHQESCFTDTQESSSRQTENQMVETAIPSKTKFTEIDNKGPKSPLLQPEQSCFRRAIRFVIIMFIILGVFYIILIGSQYVYLDLKGIARSWDLRIPKLRFTKKCSPPI